MCNAARRVGCGVQLRPRPTAPPIFERLGGHAPAFGGDLTSTSGATDSTNPYYPSLLCDTLAFFGVGLCWGLEKASAAANLLGPGVGIDAGLNAEGGLVSESTGRARGRNWRTSAGKTPPLQGAPEPALLVMKHVLGIDSVEKVYADEVGVLRRRVGWGGGFFNLQHALRIYWFVCDSTASLLR